MKKFISQALIVSLFSLALVGVSFPNFVHADLTSLAISAGTNAASSIASNGGTLGGLVGGVAGFLIQPIASVALQLMSLLSYLSGLALNKSIDFTIVHMADNITGSAPGSLAGSISTVWGTIRDIANMSFIFILLYAAIMTMFDEGDYQKTIKNIIIAAILVNFSIFFTKVIIDIGNLIALTFYHAIVPVATASGAAPGGISDIFAQALALPTLWNGTISATNIITIGVMGSGFLLVSSFVFLAVALMFVVRYVILILVIVLSPLMFVADVIPGLSKYGKQWWDALLNQTFFPAVYFLLTWIVVKLISSPGFIPTNHNLATAIGGVPGQAASIAADPSAASTIFNFIIIIAFLIASLVIAKGMADKGSAGLNKWVRERAGGATIGVAGRFARGTIGRAGQALADNEKLKAAAPTSRLARLALAASNKTAGASFDLRGTGLGGTLGAGKAQSGGFAKDMKNKVDAQKKFADSLKPSDLVVAQAEAALEEAKKTGNGANIAAAQARVDGLKGADEKSLRERKIKEIRIQEQVDEKEAKRRLKTLEDQRFNKVAEYMSGGLNEKDAKTRAAAEGVGWAPEAIKGAGNERKEAYAKDLQQSTTFAVPLSSTRSVNFDLTGRVGFIGPVKKENLNAAIAIRKSIKEKKPGEKIAEEIEKQAKESGESDPNAGGATPAPGPAGGAPGGAPPTTP